MEGRERRRVWRRGWKSANVGLMGQMCGRKKGRREECGGRRREECGGEGRSVEVKGGVWGWEECGGGRREECRGEEGRSGHLCMRFCEHSSEHCLDLL